MDIESPASGRLPEVTGPEPAARRSGAAARIGRLRGRLLIEPGAIDLERRGYQAGRPDIRAKLAAHAMTFLTGYNAAIRADGPDASELDAQPDRARGFAVEGTATACTLLDLITCARGRRTRRLLAIAGDTYPHLVHLGAGWAMAKLRWPVWAGLGALDPRLRWLAYDGWGFALGAFGGSEAVRRLARHSSQCGSRCKLRHQGMGRCLWFTGNADPFRVAAAIEMFPPMHRDDLWSGVGFAAIYAGAAGPTELARLDDLAGGSRADLAAGAAFAAGVRHRAADVDDDAEAAVRALTGAGLAEAAGWSTAAWSTTSGRKGSAAGYLAWRQRLRDLAVG